MLVDPCEQPYYLDIQYTQLQTYVQIQTQPTYPNTQQTFSSSQFNQSSTMNYHKYFLNDSVVMLTKNNWFNFKIGIRILIQFYKWKCLWFFRKNLRRKSSRNMVSWFNFEKWRNELKKPWRIISNPIKELFRRRIRKVNFDSFIWKNNFNGRTILERFVFW